MLSLKMEGFHSEVKTGMSRRLEDAISRLSLALEELEENRRQEEHFNSVGAKWKQVAKVIDRSATHLVHSLSSGTDQPHSRFPFCFFLAFSILNTSV